MKAKDLRLTPLQGGTVRVELTLADRSQLEKLSKLTDCDLNVEIKKYRKKRSLTANAYLWKLLDDLAKVLKSTKEEVYHEAVRKVGLFDEFEMPREAVKPIATKWCKKGEGWQVEVSNHCTDDGRRVVRFYSGSSVYDSLEFSRLIEYVVDECKELGIETRPQEEIDRLIDMIGE